jgi:hypothetical protein
VPQWLQDQYKNLSQTAYNTVIDPATGQPKQMADYTGQMQASTNPYLSQAQNTAAGMKAPDFGTVNANMLDAAAASQGQYRDQNAINITGSYAPGTYAPGQFQQQDVQFKDTLAGYNPNVQAYTSQAATFKPSDFAAQTYNFTPDKVAAERVAAQQIQGPQRSDIRDVNAPANLQQYLINQPADVQAQALQQYLMAQPKDIAAGQLDPAKQWTDPGTQQQYMDPYAGAVTDIAARKAKETFYSQLADEGGRAAAAGALGGSRQALVDATMRRDYATQVSDMQAQGLEAAYQNAQQQFERDRTAGTQTGQFNIQAALDAAKSNQAAGLTAGQANLQSQLATQQLGAQTGLQAALANQQAGLDTSKANQAAQLGVQQLGTQAGMQAALANQQADIGYAGLGTDVAKANQAAALNAAQSNQSTGLQAGMANQSTGLQAQMEGAKLGSQEREFGANLGQEAAIEQAKLQQQTNLANQGAQMSAQQLGSTLGLDALKTQYAGGLQAGLANQQAGLDLTKLGEQSRQYGFGQQQQGEQFGANLNLQTQQAQQDAVNAAIRNNLTAAGQTADIFGRVGANDSLAFQNQLAANAQVGNLGMFQQQQDQATADKQFQLWQLQKAYPMASMEQLAQMLNQTAAPFTTQTQTGYTRQPSMFNQIAGGLIAGAGAVSNFALPGSGSLFNFAKKPLAGDTAG